ncbi:MAG: dodecin domain-containing protein [bacterium]|nr:dodecin domain-containing protein [bacterium]
MADKVYKKIRLTGCSSESIESAINLAVAKSDESVRGTSWFEMVELRGAVNDGKVAEWQATVDVGFKVE